MAQPCNPTDTNVAIRCTHRIYQKLSPATSRPLTIKFDYTLSYGTDDSVIKCGTPGEHGEEERRSRLTAVKNRDPIDLYAFIRAPVYTAALQCQYQGVATGIKVSRSHIHYNIYTYKIYYYHNLYVYYLLLKKQRCTYVPIK